MMPQFSTQKTLSFFSLFVYLLLSGSAYSFGVGESDARQVASNFYNHTAHRQVSDIHLAHAYYYKNDNSNEPIFFIFNINNSGFVIVSAENRVQPVLGYSTAALFNQDHSPSFAAWLDNYYRQIVEVKEKVTDQTPHADWNRFLRNEFDGSRATSAVNPLVQTQWGQSGNYNTMCPYDSVGGGRAPTGCGATAMAQIMKFWNYPSTGKWSHSYMSWGIGKQYANFGNTTYNWSNMPNTLTGPNNDVALLMYHVGVAIDMQYSISGSSSSIQLAVNPSPYTSLKSFFGYDPTTIQMVDRATKIDPQWIAILKTELDAGRPFEYDGYPTNGNDPGHVWVCDGYDANNMFHMNWGWTGSCDGYYSVNNLYPTAIPSGFNSSHHLVIGIKPQPVNAKPRAGYISTSNIICAGGSIQFADSSFGGTPTSWKWIFPGGSPATSTQQNPAVTYATGGKYNVTLIATNANGSDTFTRNNYANVVPVVNLPLTENFEAAVANNFPPSGWTVYGELNSLSYYFPTWTSGLFISAYGQGLVSAAKNFFTDVVGGTLDMLSTPILNMSSTNGVRIKFDYAYAMRDSVRADSLSIFYTDGCGGEVNIVKTMGGRSFITAPDTAGSFKPKASQWKTDSIDILVPNTINQVRLGFITKSAQGNNLFIDNVKISAVNVTGIEAEKEPDLFSAYPNPVGNTLFVRTNGKGTTQYDITNMLGQTILSGTFTGEQQVIDFSSATNGCYLLRLKGEGSELVKKIIK